jgi:hypothetical protein
MQKCECVDGKIICLSVLLCVCFNLLISLTQAIDSDHVRHNLSHFSNEMQHHCEDLLFFELSDKEFTATLTHLNVNINTVQLISSLGVTSMELLDMSYEELKNMIHLSPDDVWRISQCILYASVDGQTLDNTDKWNCIYPDDIDVLVHISLKSLIFRCSGDPEFPPFGSCSSEMTMKCQATSLAS